MISNKEVIAILFLLIALICALNAGIFGNNLPTATSSEQLTQQCISISTAYICIIYALSTWLYHSNYSEPRQHMRYVLLAMLLIMIGANLASMSVIIKQNFFNPVQDGIDISTVLSKYSQACVTLTIVCIVLTIVLLLVVLVIQSMITYKKLKRQSVHMAG